MKNLIVLVMSLMVGSWSYAYDISGVYQLNGLKGHGTSDFEEHPFPCVIKVDLEQNVVGVINSNDPLGLNVAFLDGDQVENIKRSPGQLALKTKSHSSPGYCGDWIKARGVTMELTITSERVEFVTSYWCGFSKDTLTTICEIQ